MNMAPKNTICLWFDKIATDDQQETDRYWNAIVGNGGKESQCGWCKDRWASPLSRRRGEVDGIPLE
jgi:predicted 3-demethylubiquinone-9 3-methyltransferase (glyoxalase superfamily)